VIALNLKIDKAEPEKMGEKVLPAIYRGMIKGMHLVESRTKGYYLSGGALNVVTGHLRRSIYTKVVTRGNKVMGSIGTHVNYGKKWEEGFFMGPFGRVKPRPFLKPAIIDKIDQVTKLIGKKIEVALK